MATELKISDSQPWLRTGSAAFFLTLLVLVLVRLTWVQLRTFQVFPEPSMTTTARIMDSVRNDPCSEIILKNSRVIYDSNNSNPISVPMNRWGGAEVSRQGIPPDWVGNRLELRLLCMGDVFDNNLLVRLNETFFFLTCMVIGLLCRMVTGRWFVGIISIISLMSRGRVLGELGAIGVTYPLMLAFSGWALTVLWFHMTRSRVVLMLGGLIVALAAALDWRLAGLHVIFPVSIALAWIAARRARKSTEGVPGDQTLDVGATRVRWLTPLSTAELLHLARDKRRLVLDLVTYGVLAGIGLIITYQIWMLSCRGISDCSLSSMRRSARLELLSFGRWNKSWWLLFQEWDIHFLWSLFGLVFLGAAGRRTLGSRYVEGALTVLVGCVVVGVMRIWYFPMELSLAKVTEWHRLQHILIWAEPVILAFAIVSIYRIVELLRHWSQAKGSQ